MAALRSWNFMLDDASPMFRYYPHADGLNNTTGWQSVYNTGSNSSHHVTQMPNASVTLSFFGIFIIVPPNLVTDFPRGTGVTIFGSSNATYLVYFDGSESLMSTHPDGILFQSKDAKLTRHKVKLQVKSVNATQQLRLNKAVVSSTVIGRLAVPKISRHSSDARLMKTRGTWHERDPSNHFPLNPTSNITVRATRSPGDSISFSFFGRAVAIYGPVNATSGLFSVSHGSKVHVLNASSPIPIEETLLYYEDGFNEVNSTSITMTNLGTGRTMFAMSRAKVIYFNSTEQNSVQLASAARDIREERHTRMIIGVVLGIVGIIALLACSMLIVRRRTKRSNKSQITPYEINEQIMSRRLNPSSKESQSIPEARTITQRTTSSIVERVHMLVSRQVDSTKAVEHRHGSLPPYPGSVPIRTSISV